MNSMIKKIERYLNRQEESSRGDSQRPGRKAKRPKYGRSVFAVLCAAAMTMTTVAADLPAQAAVNRTSSYEGDATDAAYDENAGTAEGEGNASEAAGSTGADTVYGTDSGDASADTFGESTGSGKSVSEDTSASGSNDAGQSGNDAAQDQDSEQTTDEATSEEDTEEAVSYASGTLTYGTDDDAYKVSVTFDESALLPEGTTLSAAEIPADNDQDQYDYDNYLAQAQNKLSEEDEKNGADAETIDAVHFYDILFTDADGNKVEPDPNANLQVSISYKGGLEKTEEQSVQIFHFTDDNDTSTDKIDLLTNPNVSGDDTNVKFDGISFDTNQFSVYGVALISTPAKEEAANSETEINAEEPATAESNAAEKAAPAEATSNEAAPTEAATDTSEETDTSDTAATANENSEEAVTSTAPTSEEKTDAETAENASQSTTESTEKSADESTPSEEETGYATGSQEATVGNATVNVSYTEDSRIPEGAQLVAEKADDEESYQSKAEGLLADYEIEGGSYLDIHFELNGEEYPVKNDTKVTVTFDNQTALGENEEIKVVHFGKNGPELIESTSQDKAGFVGGLKNSLRKIRSMFTGQEATSTVKREVTFTANEFSVYGIVVTTSASSEEENVDSDTLKTRSSDCETAESSEEDTLRTDSSTTDSTSSEESSDADEKKGESIPTAPTVSVEKETETSADENTSLLQKIKNGLESITGIGQPTVKSISGSQIAADGTYTTTFYGYKYDDGETKPYKGTLSVTVSDGKISSVSYSGKKSEKISPVVSTAAADYIGKAASVSAINAVDATSSATTKGKSTTQKYSTDDLGTAIATAISSADPSGDTSDDDAAGSVADGTYTGSASNSSSSESNNLVVTVTVSGGKITNIAAADGTVGTWDDLLTTVKNELNGKNANTDNVDAVSSATTQGWTDTVKTAVKNALNSSGNSSGNSGSLAGTSTSTSNVGKIYVKKSWDGVTPASGTSVTASVTASDGTSQNVTLNSDNSWTDSVTTDTSKTYTVKETGVTNSSGTDISSQYNASISGPVSGTETVSGGGGSSSGTNVGTFSSSDTEVSLGVNDYATLTSSGDLSWSIQSTSSSGVVSLSTNSGSSVVVTGLKAGTATVRGSYMGIMNFDWNITVSGSGSGNTTINTATYTITNTEAASQTQKATITNPGTKTYSSGTSLTMNCTGCSVSGVTSSNDNILVAQSGNVLTFTLASEVTTSQTATITVIGKAGTGYSDPDPITFSVTVNPSEDAVFGFGSYYASMKKGGSQDISIIATHVTRTSGPTSSDPSVATVTLSDDGTSFTVNALSAGTTTISMVGVADSGYNWYQGDGNQSITITVTDTSDSGGISGGETSDDNMTLSKTATRDNDSDTYNVELSAYAKSKTITTTSGGQDIVMVLDMSGTMNPNSRNGYVNKLEDYLKPAALSFLKALKDSNAHHQVAIVTFNEQAYTVAGLTDIQDGYDTLVSYINSFTNGNVNNADGIGATKSAGSSHMYDGISTANSILGNGSSSSKSMMIYSDGLPNRYGDESDSTAEGYCRTYANDAKDAGYKVYTVTTDSSASSFMQELSSGDGYYATAASASSLESQFKAAAETMTSTASAVTLDGSDALVDLFNTDSFNYDDATVSLSSVSLNDESNSTSTGLSYSWITSGGHRTGIRVRGFDYSSHYEGSSDPRKLVVKLSNVKVASSVDRTEEHTDVPTNLEKSGVYDGSTESGTLVAEFTIPKVTIPATETLKYTTITVKNVVSDDDTSSSFSYEVAVTRNGSTSLQTFTLNGNGSKASISVPVGAQIDVSQTVTDSNYTLTDISGGTLDGKKDGTTYTISSMPDSTGTITFTNTRKTITPTQSDEIDGVTKVTVKKNWETTAANSVTVQLTPSSGNSQRATLSESNNWQYTFEDLDSSLTYTISETAVDGSESNLSKYNISITGGKGDDDDNNTTSGPTAQAMGSETVGNTYILVYGSGSSLYALTASGTSVVGTPVTVSNGVITSTVTDSMKWTVNSGNGTLVNQGNSSNPYLTFTYNSPYMGSSTSSYSTKFTFQSNGSITGGYDYSITASGTSTFGNNYGTSGTAFTPYLVNTTSNSKANIVLKAASSSDSAEKISALTSASDGNTYVFVYNGYALADNNGTLVGVPVTISNGKISSVPKNAEWKVAASSFNSNSSYHSAQNVSTGNYLGYSSGGPGTLSSEGSQASVVRFYDNRYGINVGYSTSSTSIVLNGTSVSGNSSSGSSFDAYEVTASTSDSSSTATYTITNAAAGGATPVNPGSTGTVTMQVKKEWASGTEKADSITATITNTEDSSDVHTVTLSESNDWQEEITDLSMSAQYEVKETAATKDGKDVLSDYTSSISLTQKSNTTATPTGGTGSYQRSGSSGNYTYSYTYDNATRFDSTGNRALYTASGQTFNGDVHIGPNVTVTFSNCKFYGSIVPEDNTAIAAYSGSSNRFYITSSAGVTLTEGGSIVATVDQGQSFSGAIATYPGTLSDNGITYTLNTSRSSVTAPYGFTYSIDDSTNYSGYKDFNVSGTAPNTDGYVLLLANVVYSPSGYGSSVSFSIPMYVAVGNVSPTTAPTTPVYTITNTASAAPAPDPNPTTPTAGAPTHEKALDSETIASDGTWTLGLSAGGAITEEKKEETTADNYDVIIAVDTSGSMTTGRLQILKNAVSESGLISNILKNSKNRVAIVEFAAGFDNGGTTDGMVGFIPSDYPTYDDARVVQTWTSNASTAENSFTNLSAHTDYATNVGAALYTANKDLLSDGTNKKAIILLSDGEPNTYYDSTGHSPSTSDGNSDWAQTKNYAYTQASEISGKVDAFYSISTAASSSSDNPKEFLATLGSYFGKHAEYDGNDNLDSLKEAFSSISSSITTNTNTYTNVSITDTLTDNFEFASTADSNFWVEKAKTDGTGSAETLSSSDYTISLSNNNKTVTATLGTLAGGYTYTLKFKIKATQSGYDAAATAVAGGNSDGNKLATNTTATMTYTANGATSADTTYEETPKATVPTSILNVEKSWAEDTETDRPESITMTLHDGNTDTKRTVVLNSSNDWKGSFVVSAGPTGHTYSVTESDVSGYDVSYPTSGTVLRGTASRTGTYIVTNTKTQNDTPLTSIRNASDGSKLLITFLALAAIGAFCWWVSRRRLT